MRAAPLAEEAQAYLADRTAQGSAQGTIVHERRALTALLDFLARQGAESVSEVDQAMVQGYLAERHSLALERAHIAGPETYTRRCALHLRSFFRWAVKSGRILVSPMDGLRMPRGELRLPRDVLTREETWRLLKAPDTNEVLGIRDRAMIEIMYSSALRRREMMELDLGDVDLAERRVLIRRSKARKDRVVPVGAEAARWMRRYLSESRPVLERDSSLQAFFLTTHGLRFQRNLPNTLLGNYGRMAGIARRVTPYTMRHTCATHMLQAGADIRHIQELLGHEEIKTTQVYTHVAIADVKEAHRRFHPRGGIGAVEEVGSSGLKKEEVGE